MPLALEWITATAVGSRAENGRSSNLVCLHRKNPCSKPTGNEWRAGP
jgi:hypothetical protein